MSRSTSSVRFDILSLFLYFEDIENIMSGLEKELKSSDSAELPNVEGSSDGAAELYIDPVKETKMMRKFDVCL